MTVYAVCCPGRGFFVRRDEELLEDVFSSRLGEACFFRSEETAVEYAVALTERSDGDCFWVYGVTRLPRKWRGMA